MGNDLQRSAEWFSARVGCLTASAVADILPSVKALKSGEVKKTYRDSRETLKDVIIAERLSGEPRNTFTTAAMQWGIDHEDEARDWYQVETGELVDLTGFINHPSVQWLGASPDGLVGDDGLIEIKCPASHTHIKYVKSIRRGEVPDDYKPQMLLQLIVTGRQWCDFITYDPRVRGVEFASIRYAPTSEERDAVLEECVKFLKEVDIDIDFLTNFLTIK